MSHDHHHHEHHHSHHEHPHGESVFLWPLLLTAGFALIEIAGAFYTGSLALLGDAGHMFSDVAALALAWLGAWMAHKPASTRHSFGFVRAEVMVALLNGVLMLLVVIAIFYEAIQRLQTPHAVHGLEVMLIAFVGMVVNILVARKLHQHQHNINHRAALLHVLGDLLGSVAALLAGAIIYFTDWMAIDPILSILIAILILVSTIRLLKEALHVLMEGVPHRLDLDEISQTMHSVSNVQGVHSLHVWALSSEVTAISAHIVLTDMNDWHEVLLGLREILHEKFDIHHITLQPEVCDPLLASAGNCWLTSK